MAFLSESEKHTLVEQIKQVEAGTHAEIVTVVARQSDGYRYIPMLWAALIALSVPGIYYLYQLYAGDSWSNAVEDSVEGTRLYQIQVLIFFALAALFQISRLRLWMIPQSIKQQRAAHHAREQFFLQNLHLTQDRTGVLIFVSVAEHYVEIIVDSGISTVIGNDVWDQTVEEFVGLVRQGRIADGFSHTIEHCRDVLWTHFPATDGRPDQLPNHLIEV